LWGADGNAWAILGACQAVFKSLGYKRDDPLLQAFRLEAMKGDYVHLLRTVDRLFTVSVSGYDTMEDFIDHYNAGPDSVSDSYVKQDHGLSPELVERHIADIKANLERAMKELTT
jgi:hypothetical protein